MSATVNNSKVPARSSIPAHLKVIDFHTHFPAWNHKPWSNWQEEYVRRFGREKLDELHRRRAAAARKRWQAWNFESPKDDELSLDDKISGWKEQVERWGLRKLVFVSGGGNDRLSEIIRSDPGHFAGFAHHSPFEPGAAQELERAVVELGLRGYKVFSPMLDRPIDDEAAYPVWEAAERLGIPVLLHFGLGSEAADLGPGINANPLSLRRVALSFPYLNFVVPHFGAGYLRETLHLCWGCQNVYVDTSGSNHWMHWMPERLTMGDVLRRFYETVGPERIIFGTDSSFLPRGWVYPYFEQLHRVSIDLNMPQEHIDLIFGGNAERLLENRPFRAKLGD